MYAIMGITGQVGGAVGRTLLAASQPVRAIVRDADKGQAWAQRGCEVALAEINDTTSLANAFRGVQGVFVLVPPNFDPSPQFSEARAAAVSLRAALAAAEPARVVYLSTIGAQANRLNLLTQHTIIERALGELPTPITFLRPAWFMENFSWDVAPAREQGLILKCHDIGYAEKCHDIGYRALNPLVDPRSPITKLLGNRRYRFAFQVRLYCMFSVALGLLLHAFLPMRERPR